MIVAIILDYMYLQHRPRRLWLFWKKAHLEMEARLKELITMAIIMQDDEDEGLGGDNDRK